ncbi:MAG: HIT family protein [Bacteroidales bacterium]|jgi:histidine triad (HIT) family protein|nr:HIT family protein [Bacteroidales bacterium]
MATIFTRIINGEIPCYKIAEDDKYFAFLDINPIREGHTLVITKQETDYIFDLDDVILAGLMVFSKKISKAIAAAIPCARIGVAVVGLEVPHTHIHLVPIDTIQDLNFKNPKLTFTPEQFREIAERISRNVVL